MAAEDHDGESRLNERRLTSVDIDKDKGSFVAVMRIRVSSEVCIE